MPPFYFFIVFNDLADARLVCTGSKPIHRPVFRLLTATSLHREKDNPLIYKESGMSLDKDTFLPTPEHPRLQSILLQ